MPAARCPVPGPSVGDVSVTPTTVVLVRHGESQVTVDQVVGGHAACTGLSDRGRRQAERLRDRLLASGLLSTADALYASVLARAVETAEVIGPGVGGGRLEVTKRCDLCELHVGEGDGMPWAEFTQVYGQPPWDSDPTAVLSPGSESWTSFVARASAGLHRVADDHPGQLVVIACHGGVIEASFQAFGGLAEAPGARLYPANTGITIWSQEPGRPWRLDRYNDSAHLDGLDH